MTTLPVREIVLYKHGVGFYVREGFTEADEIALTFRADEINDVLKSLAVFDHSGGQVLGIHYQTPMDIFHRLGESAMNLGDSTAMVDLVKQLRGRRAKFTFEPTPGSLQPIIGRVLGVDERKDEEERIVSILADNDEAYVFPFKALRWVKMLDERTQHDLHFFLDTSMTEDIRREVRVRLEKVDAMHELAIYYIAPAPTWRVSYRIVAQSVANTDKGEAILQGWGLFDNRLEEDLKDVRVTLVAGQPISFIYDLYESRIPQRPTIKDEARIAPGPVEFDSYADDDEISETFFALEERLDTQSFGAAKARASSSGAMFARRATPPAPKQPLTESKDAGELFQYRVTAPVSIKRGESALVPIIYATVKYERELLYNGGKLPKHPVASLRFNNSTGLTLEKGPVTVVEDEDYRGEAVIAFTKENTEVYVPYAVELGIHVHEDAKTFETTTGIKLEGRYAVYETYRIYQTVYTLENKLAESRTVTIEAPVQTFQELFDTSVPVAETAEFRRWRVDIARNSKVTFIRKERQLLHNRREVKSLSYAELDQYLEQGWLTSGKIDRLRDLLDARKTVAQSNAQIKKLNEEQEDIQRQQEQLRANMGALNAQGDEAAFRRRIVQQLESTQDRLDAIQLEREGYHERIKLAEKREHDILASFGEKAT